MRLWAALDTNCNTFFGQTWGIESPLYTETDNTALHTIKKNLITDMQNRLVHHLIITKLLCALPKCMSVQNYIVNLDFHVRCQT